MTRLWFQPQRYSKLWCFSILVPVTAVNFRKITVLMMLKLADAGLHRVADLGWGSGDNDIKVMIDVTMQLLPNSLG